MLNGFSEKNIDITYNDRLKEKIPIYDFLGQNICGIDILLKKSLRIF